MFFGRPERARALDDIIRVFAMPLTASDATMPPASSDSRALLRKKLKEKRDERLGVGRVSRVSEAEAHVQELCGDDPALLKIAHAMLQGKKPPGAGTRPPVLADVCDEEESPPLSTNPLSTPASGSGGASDVLFDEDEDVPPTSCASSLDEASTKSKVDPTDVRRATDESDES